MTAGCSTSTWSTASRTATRTGRPGSCGPNRPPRSGRSTSVPARPETARHFLRPRCPSPGGPVRHQVRPLPKESDMSRYLYLYRGPATPMDDFTPEQGEEQMRAWGEWMGRVGPALADGGAPFGTRAAVADDGTTAEPGDLNGYTIVEADSI